MKLGYIRVSNDKKATALQEDALRHEPCDRTFIDKMTGTRFDRPVFEQVLDVARRDDITVIWRLDRLGRSLNDLIKIVTLLRERGIELRSLKENLETATPTGKLKFHVIGALAEFERDLISERTKAGLDAARARGRKGGRPGALTTVEPRMLARAKALYAATQNTVSEIMQMTGFRSRTTCYRQVVNGES